MKTFLKITGAVVLVFVIILISLNLYLNDERLKSIILPQVQEATGSQVEVDKMSMTFFRTFPRFGLELEGLVVPDLTGAHVLTLDDLLLSIELIPLMRRELSISRLTLNGPNIFYTVYEDSTTNIDFLISPDHDPDEASQIDLSIPRITVSDGSVIYLDATTATNMSLNGLNADLSLFYSDIIESRVNATLESLNFEMDGTSYVNNLSLSLNQSSTLDLDQEILTVTEGTLAIRGLSLNLLGSISNWSSGQTNLSLQFTSASENFGELLRLAPSDYDEALNGLVTRGTLSIDGSIEGILNEDSIPDIDLAILVSEGYMQNPDLPEAIEDIHLELLFSNELATIRNLRARAGVNSITGSGEIVNPLEDDARFSMDLDGDVNLNTISSFYPIDELGIENLAGLLKVNANASGRIDQPEEAIFSGLFNLSDGLLKYADVPRAIENINFIANANQDRIEISESGFTAADNRMTLSGSIIRPLDENERTVDINSVINFDLGTIKEFYPIDEDTLAMRGSLVADISLRGKPDPDQIETLLQQSTFYLTNGYLYHSIVNNPLEDITFRAVANGRRLNISEGRFKTGDNSLAMSGSIVNYLSDNPEVDLTFDGIALLSSISGYYSLEPWISELTGNAVMNLNTRGPANDVTQIALTGALEVSDVTAAGDSIPLPVTNLSGRMDIRPTQMTLERFSMNYGSTDIELQGNLQNYMSFLDENSTGSQIPSITGTYRSRFLNIDEMIDWEEEADEDPFPIDLPNLQANVDAEIDRLVIFGLPITEIKGRSRISPEQIEVSEAEARFFDGTAEGRFIWNVPDPLQTDITFNGSLTGLTAESFFRETGFLGENSTIHEYLTGAFSGELDYSVNLTPSLDPDITTARSAGNFGMTRARLRGHPIQVEIARFLNASDLESLALDEWNATYTINDAVMTLKDFRLTSGNLGIELEGTLNMVTDRIEYNATLLLPERFKRGIASVISTSAADALQLEDGRMAIPIRITGTTATPRVGPNTDVIERIIQDRVREGAGDLLRRLFGG